MASPPRSPPPDQGRPVPFAPRGRGARGNPVNRFQPLHLEPDEALADQSPADRAPADQVPTRFLVDSSRSIIATNDSPDVGFAASVNPYRGCEHGCSYCYARPFHEYLGFSAGRDFETRILVKERAPELLRQQLASPQWRPQTLALSGVTDPYQPVERKLGITRRCLEVLTEARHPVAIITKSSLVTRDLDLLAELAEHRAAAVNLSITTLDPEVARRMEPRGSHPRERLRALRQLSEAGIPCGVMMAPVIPGLTDHEMPELLAAAADAGASWARYIVLRLPGAVAELFDDWLERHYPDRRDKVMNRVRELRGGRLYDPRFGHRMRGEGVFADQLRGLYAASLRRAGLTRNSPELSTAAFRRPGGQLSLFEPTC